MPSSLVTHSQLSAPPYGQKDELQLSWNIDIFLFEKKSIHIHSNVKRSLLMNFYVQFMKILQQLE